MPLYEIEHIIPLTSDAKAAFAVAINEIHTKLFATPSIFVNVRFIDSTNNDLFIGGRKVS